jgi:hypothetical protein
MNKFRFDLVFAISLICVLLVSCSTGPVKQVPKTSESLSDIISDDVFKIVQRKINTERKIEAWEFGQTGMAAWIKKNDANMSPAKQFYKICSPSQKYQSPFVEHYRWRDQFAEYDQLKSDDKDDVRLFIVGVITDSFYCGSIMQLSFPLEDAVEQAKQEPNTPCIENLKNIPHSQRYNKLFFEPIDRDLTLLKRHSSIKDTISETLRESVLCSF